MKQLQKSISRLVSSSSSEPDDGGTAGESELETLRTEAQRIKDESQTKNARINVCTDEIHRLALSLPNLSSRETPVGDDPRLIGYINFDPNNPPAWATTDAKNQHQRNHVTLGTNLGLLDFPSASTTSGWGWYYLTNDGAMLEQALIHYALRLARNRGWKVISPPSIVYSYIAEACGFQPRDQHNEQQIWALERGSSEREKERLKPQRSLAGTAEIPLAGMLAGREVEGGELPIRVVAASRCYRAEAGARGVGTKGLYRVHEFTKVELFGWADADADTNVNEGGGGGKSTSDILFSELIDLQREILTSLNLPCRILEMPTADLGASATRKCDIETLFPSRLTGGNLDSAWGEITSASICTDYQSRRLGTRVRGGGPGRKESRFPHTVNGTAIAIPRVLAAIIENGWDEGVGGIVVPEVLRMWMGKDVIKGGDS